MRHDLIYAFRSLARNPLFSTIAIATLAMGVGLNTSVFSIVNVLLFSPPPVERPDELVWISSASSKPDGPRGNMTYPDVDDLRGVPAVSGVMAYGYVQANVAHAGQAERLGGEIVTGDYFDVLGIRPYRGRLITPDDDRSGKPIAVISFGLWQRMMGGRDDAVGAAIHINGAAFTIGGIAPRGFRGPDVFSHADVWVSIGASRLMNPDGGTPTSRTLWWLRAIARLAPGVTPTGATAALKARAAAIAQAFPASHDGFTVNLDAIGGVSPGDEEKVIPLAAILLGATVTVLLIACANVANLLVVRGVATRRERAIRVALGASRGRVLRQQLVESAMLAAAGGAAGLLLSMWSTELLLRFAGVPLEADLSPDRRVLGFAIGVSALTALLFGLAPALRSASGSPAGSLKGDHTSGDGRPRSRFQGFLVAGQLALSMVLLLTAGLFLKSLIAARTVDVGFDPRGRVSMSFNLRMHGYTPERATAFQQAVIDRVRALPGVRTATLAAMVPLGDRVEISRPTFPDRPDAASERVSLNYVWPEFFSTLGIPIVAGRPLDGRDMGPQPFAAVISESMARRHWPDRSPLGERFSLNGSRGPFLEVVGVARDTIIDELNDGGWSAAYLPRRSGGDDTALIAHVDIATGEALRALEAQVHALDPTVAVFQPLTMSQHIANRLDGERALSRMLSVVGLLALALAAIGLYGVVAYTVVRRTREIGVRVALGAQPRDVVRLFVNDAVRLALIGVAAGFVPAVAVTALLASSLVGVRLADPIAMAGVIAVLGTVTLAAAYLPARRASHMNPLTALRTE
jgi:predicted permease